MEKDGESIQNGSETGNNGGETLAGFKAKIEARLSQLRRRRQRVMEELGPIDAAIHELEQLLGIDGREYGLWEERPGDVLDPGTMVKEAYQQGMLQPMGESKNPQRVVRTPVDMGRPGPMDNPGGVGVETRGYVKSPGGTSVPTNAEMLRQQLHGRVG